MSMASDDTMIVDSSVQDDSQHHHPHNMSRLSMCTTHSKHPAYDDDSDDEDDGGGVEMSMYMSRLSIEGSDGDADEELSDDHKDCKGVISDVSSDSDKKLGCFSLPVTPPRQRIRYGYLNQSIGTKEYASENEAAGMVVRNKMRRSSRRRSIRERWMEKAWKKDGEVYDEDSKMELSINRSCESECLVITRPKGGKRSLCMDLEEVKACRDLGFELEHEMTLEMPGRISMSCSTIDTSSGGNSPISHCKISSPGDDPRDVKARLKVWAQAVALAFATRRAT